MKKLLLLSFFALGAATVWGQTKYGLFIGINTYFPEGATESADRSAPPNLNGCVNDALAVKEIMVTKFGFAEDKTYTLLNQDASRQRIIKELTDLSKRVKKGDIVFIFYAGHGSQVNNSLSKENDKKDETIVPADAYKGEFDLRDKEMAVLLNKLVDAGAVVTAIFDSCHSGSMSRDPDAKPVLRFTSPDKRDVMDATEPTPPEDRGALIISAARDVEPAKEIKDETGTPHGGFTVSLLQVLRDETGSSSAQQMFDRIEALMEFYNLTQKPVIAANETRRNTNLLGIEGKQVSNKLLIPVIKISGTEIILNAGFASGINVKTELVRKTEKGNVKLQVVRMESINKSVAVLKEGDIKWIKPGDAFEVSNIVMSASAAIKVYVYYSGFDANSLTQTVKNIGGGNLNWKLGTGGSPAYQSLYYANNKWMVAYQDKKTEELGADISLESLMGKVAKDSSLVFNIPVTQNIGNLFNENFKAVTNVQVVKNPADADYYLVGRWNAGKIEYAFINPEKIYFNNQNANALPAQTSYFPLGSTAEADKQLVDTLKDYILRIAKVKSWLTLQGPPDDGSFPFSFKLRKSSTGELFDDGDEVQYQDTFGLVFTLDEANEAYWDRNKRYIYIFSIDKNAKMTLLYPQTITGENVYPVVDRNTFEIKQNAPIGRKAIFRISGDSGTDNYIMLTSSTPISNLDIFRQEGVYRSEGERHGEPTELEKLLSGVGQETRNDLIAPADWSIHRISVKCVPRK